ncbi:thermonuclease family protein [Ottowia sp.]|uniref:thermonuclease family protein n=1 Tax=Ottowia sp. TaxID=1898956 RepID=UPI0034266E11
MAAGPLRAQDGQRPPVGTPWNARVLYVVDGDSLWVRPEGGGFRARLRLEGIDAPEICQDQGPESRAALQDLALGRRVRVTVRTYDRYGRAIASVVRLDGEVDLARRMGWPAVTPGTRPTAGTRASIPRSRRSPVGPDSGCLPRPLRCRRPIFGAAMDPARCRCAEGLPRTRPNGCVCLKTRAKSSYERHSALEVSYRWGQSFVEQQP